MCFSGYTNLALEGGSKRNQGRIIAKSKICNTMSMPSWDLPLEKRICHGTTGTSKALEMRAILTSKTDRHIIDNVT